MAAVGDGTFVLTFPTHGKVRWVNGNCTAIKTLDLTKARAVDVADGITYIMDDKALYKLETNDAGTEDPLLLVNLEDPKHAAVQPGGNHDIFIIDGQRIKRCATDGTPGGTSCIPFGDPEGRKDGPYQEQKGSFRKATDIAVSPDGDFWVSEISGPRRVAHFSGDGTWLNEWYSGQTVPAVTVEPDDPNHVWITSGEFEDDLVRLSVDYTTHEWSIDSITNVTNLRGNALTGGYVGVDWAARVNAGELYLLTSTPSKQPSIFHYDRDSHTLWPFEMWAAVNQRQLDKTATLETGICPFDANHQSMLWMDSSLNANGDVDCACNQTDECTYAGTSDSDAGNFARPKLGERFDYITFAGANDDGPDGHQYREGFRRFRAATSPDGRFPYYPGIPVGTQAFANMPSRMVKEVRSDTCSPGLPALGGLSIVPTLDAADRLWAAFNYDYGYPAATRGFCAAQPWVSLDTFVGRFKEDGTPAWLAGRVGTLYIDASQYTCPPTQPDSNFCAPRRLPSPGRLMTISHIYGVVNNALVFNPYAAENFDGGAGDGSDIYGNSQGVSPIYVYNEDGLYAGQLFGKPVDPSQPSWRYHIGGDGGRNGAIFKKDADTVYLYAGAPTSIGVFKIGWKETDWKTDHGTVTIPQNYVHPAGVLEPVGPIGNGKGLLRQYDPAANGFDTHLVGTVTPRRSGWHMFNPVGVASAMLTVNGVQMKSTRLSGRAMWLEAGHAYPIQYDCSSTGQTSCDLQPPRWAEPETNGAFFPIPASQLNPP